MFCNALIPTCIAVLLARQTGGADVLLCTQSKRTATRLMGAFLGEIPLVGMASSGIASWDSFTATRACASACACATVYGLVHVQLVRWATSRTALLARRVLRGVLWRHMVVRSGAAIANGPPAHHHAEAGQARHQRRWVYCHCLAACCLYAHGGYSHSSDRLHDTVHPVIDLWCTLQV